MRDRESGDEANVVREGGVSSLNSLSERGEVG
jgi:hypothetical protein